MIDVWLLFGLVLPFVGFLLSIFEELVAQLQEEADMGKMKVQLKFPSFNLMIHQKGGWDCDQSGT